MVLIIGKSYKCGLIETTGCHTSQMRMSAEGLPRIGMVDRHKSAGIGGVI